MTVSVITPQPLCWKIGDLVNQDAYRPTTVLKSIDNLFSLHVRHFPRGIYSALVVAVRKCRVGR